MVAVALMWLAPPSHRGPPAVHHWSPSSLFSPVEFPVGLAQLRISQVSAAPSPLQAE